jgi:hypothetical protein
LSDPAAPNSVDVRNDRESWSSALTVKCGGDLGSLIIGIKISAEKIIPYFSSQSFRIPR